MEKMQHGAHAGKEWLLRCRSKKKKQFLLEKESPSAVPGSCMAISMATKLRGTWDSSSGSACAAFSAAAFVLLVAAFRVAVCLRVLYVHIVDSLITKGTASKQVFLCCEARIAHGWCIISALTIHVSMEIQHPTRSCGFRLALVLPTCQSAPR